MLILDFCLTVSFFILSVKICEGSDNFYAKTLQKAGILHNNIINKRFLSVSLLSESFPALDQIVKLDFADLFYSQNIEETLMTEGDGYNISKTCVKHLALSGKAFAEDEQWVIKMMDSFGKPGSGFLDGNIAFYGSFDECRKVKGVLIRINSTEHVFNGQYCYLSFPISVPEYSGTQIAIVEGLCVPDSCSQDDLSAIIYKVLGFIERRNSSLVMDAICVSPTLQLDTKATVVILILCLLGIPLVVGTTYDILFLQLPRYQNSADMPTTIQQKTDDIVEDNTPRINPPLDDYIPTPGAVGRFLVAFSIYTNGKKILSTKQGAGSITCISGIRFLSMSWVVLGHAYGFIAVLGSNVAPLADALVHRWTFQVVANALVSVDTFFALSGLLVSYLTLKELRKNNGKINWYMYYFHRFWRLTPPYMLILMVDVSLFRYFGDGPFWPAQGTEHDSCKHSWWQNLLYINNFFPIDKQCMGWTWYLANDMQFFIISPLMLVPLFWSEVVGVIVCCLMLFASITAAGVISHYYNLSASVLIHLESQSTYMNTYYVKPYCRIGPYIIGILTGYFLNKTQCRLRINKYINLFCWLLATFLALIVLYGLYDPDNTHPLSNTTAALYNATHKTVWGACVCWVIFACATGNGGFVNTILSWSPFVALGRLTYCAYLLHLLVIFQYTNSRRASTYYTDEVMIYVYIGCLVIANMAAFVASLLFEAPMMSLEKIIFPREKDPKIYFVKEDYNAK